MQGGRLQYVVAGRHLWVRCSISWAGLKSMCSRGPVPCPVQDPQPHHIQPDSRPLLHVQVSTLHARLEAAQAAALAAAGDSSADLESELALARGEASRLRLELDRVRAEKAAGALAPGAADEYEGRSVLGFRRRGLQGVACAEGFADGSMEVCELLKVE